MTFYSKCLKLAIAGGLAATLLSVGHAATDESELAQRSGCLACHQGDETKIGPSYKDVAGKYGKQKDAPARLAERIVAGTGPAGRGWMKEGKATLPSMPANGNVTPENAKKLATWILESKGVVASSARFVTEQVKISGAVQNPMTLSVAELKQFPPQSVGEIPIVCQSGANLGKLENLKGVLLRDILEKATVVSKSHNDVKKMAIIATASDDYKVVFSWSEVFNSPLGEEIIVFYERNGQPLADDEGRIAMVSAKDIRTGPRHVKWLNGIEVRKIVD